MTQILIVAIPLLLLALVGGLLYVSVRCVIRFPILSLIVFAVLVSSSVIYYKHFEKQLRLSYIPEGLKVEKIIYASEESWGFGPGGNETGVIVYELPDTIGEQISKIGIDYFSSLQPLSGDSHDWHGQFEKWYSTPISYNDSWSYTQSGNKTTQDTFVPKIETYLLKYGFGIPLDPVIANAIDTAISKKGNFFAYGRIGMIIVIPETRRVVFAYNG